MKDDYIVIYAVVPKYIYESKRLTPEEKLIAERIIYLCKKEGYCWITNKKLAEMYNIRLETASRHIKKLEQIGLIKCSYNHNDKNTRRIIKLVDNIWTTWSTKTKSDDQVGINYMVKHNNKYNKERKYKENTLSPSWLYEDLKIIPASKEEKEEMDTILDSIINS